MKHWDMFMRKIEPIASRVPYMTSPGNHEFLFNFTAYKHRFAMPTKDEPFGMFYDLSFNAGQLSIIMMDTESQLDIAAMSAPQVEWLERRLAPPLPGSSAASSAARWTIALGHRPLYCSQTHGSDIPGGNELLRARVEGILNAGGVDLVVQGHVHDYERSLPVKDGQPTATNYSGHFTAPVYVVNGAAGNRSGFAFARRCVRDCFRIDAELTFVHPFFSSPSSTKQTQGSQRPSDGDAPLVAPRSGGALACGLLRRSHRYDDLPSLAAASLE